LDLVKRVPDVSKRQLAVDHVVEDATQAPDVRLEGDLDHFRSTPSLALILSSNEKNKQLEL
jgi:hypothetical protein